MKRFAFLFLFAGSLVPLASAQETDIFNSASTLIICVCPRPTQTMLVSALVSVSWLFAISN
jgi:hypothetical protein